MCVTLWGCTGEPHFVPVLRELTTTQGEGKDKHQVHLSLRLHPCRATSKTLPLRGQLYPHSSTSARKMGANITQAEVPRRLSPWGLLSPAAEPTRDGRPKERGLSCPQRSSEGPGHGRRRPPRPLSLAGLTQAAQRMKSTGLISGIVFGVVCFITNNIQ